MANTTSKPTPFAKKPAGAPTGKLPLTAGKPASTLKPGAPGKPAAGRPGQAPVKAPNKSLFKNIGDTRPSFQSNYERSGRYFARIDRVKVEPNRKNEDRMVVEQTVLHVIDITEAPLPHKPGEQMAHIMSSKHDSFLGNVKSFALGATGCPEEEITEDLIWQLAGDTQPLAGTIVEKYNKDITTRDGNPFTVVSYVRPVSAAELKEVLETCDYGPRVIERFFRDGLLDRMIALETEESGEIPAADAALDTDADEPAEVQEEASAEA